jgi:hypothetical protein
MTVGHAMKGERDARSRILNVSRNTQASSPEVRKIVRNSRSYLTGPFTHHIFRSGEWQAFASVSPVSPGAEQRMPAAGPVLLRCVP